MKQKNNNFLSTNLGSLVFTVSFVYLITGILAMITNFPVRFYIGMMIGGLGTAIVVYFVRVVIYKHKNK